MPTARRRRRPPCNSHCCFSGLARFWWFIFLLWQFRLCRGDFIDKVECEKDKMVVYINEVKVQEDFPTLTLDQYEVYVHQYRDTCGDHGVASQSNSLKAKRFVIPLNGACGIDNQADNTMGIHREWLVYQATVRLETVQPRSAVGRILEQRVKCVYSTSHQATASSSKLIVRGSDVNPRSTSVFGSGTVEGSAPSVDGFIELFFSGTDAQFTPLAEATVGDGVRIVLRMSHNVAYSTMKPDFCIIANKPHSSRHDPDFRELVVVKDGCSVESTPPLIPKMVYRASLATGEPEMFYSKFTMFQMGDFSELHAMCNVKLCISNAEAACDTQLPRGCFESVRRRKRRSTLDRSDLYGSLGGESLPLIDESGGGDGGRASALPLKWHRPSAMAAMQMPGRRGARPGDSLTVSGQLFVHQEPRPLSAALATRRLCFHNVTFTIMAAVLAWLFLISFICVILLACMLRKDRRRAAGESKESSSGGQRRVSSASPSLSSSSDSSGVVVAQTHRRVGMRRVVSKCGQANASVLSSAYAPSSSTATSYGVLS